ncbi:mechanosensitive ion channel family protein [Methanofollis fontis]|uniref:Mechanosensitive ion channel protein MscS n=1 Tax=Methanofollis fontis TaxID=2052832 RepID=A0A483CSR5_9EURY|nr:mechanosensitive ion channel domain-containing protein [Methanofollis fontis]TAJ44145.1 mechanosensitive ion channel protein MscS [Methanofollis fontis]
MAAGDLLKFLILLTLTMAAWTAHSFYPDTTIYRIALTLLAVLIAYLVLRIVLERVFARTIKDAKVRYSFRKAVSVLYAIAVVVIGVRIWVDDPQSLIVAYGIIGAGVAISLQDFFKNFVGSIVLFLSGVYTVGDRIEIDDSIGDVIDIGLMSTTLMELGGWVGGDQPSGRITIVPNGQVLSGTVQNYTKDYTFVWDEITVPITYDSSVGEAIELIRSIAEKETADAVQGAGEAIVQAGGKYYLLEQGIEPAVYVTLTDNWVSLTLRYVTGVWGRRAERDRISRAILDEIDGNDRIRIASTTLEIAGDLSVRERRGESSGTRQT